MLQITNVNIYGLEESILASGYPMKLDLPKSFLFNDEVFDADMDNFKDTSHFKRAKKLGNTPSNSGHNNYFKGIIVQFDVTYPLYWTTQFQRYNFVSIISSQSKMHRLEKMDLNKCMNKYVDDIIIEHLKEIQRKYNEDPTNENYMYLISNCPAGIELTMRVSLNYMSLLNIYNQRRNHKLEDWRLFCDWIKTLPYFIELTGIK